MVNPVETVPSNGHKPEMTPEVEKQLNGILNAGDFDGITSSAASPSAIEKFVERGEKVEDLLMRADFRNDRHVNAAMLLYGDAEHFGHAELKETLINVIAARTSIGGKRIETLLKAVVGQLEQENKESIGSRFRRAIFGDKVEKTQ